MSSDPVVDEIRKIREEWAARFDFDVRAIVKDAQRRDAADDREVIRLPPRPVVTSAASGDAGSSE